MSVAIVEAAIQWAHSIRNGSPGDKFDIVFHGGEPLTAGTAFYQRTLPLLRNSLKTEKLRVSMQSNLWLLDEYMCDLLAEHSVSIGTSLDGPEAITDAQRGTGYFNRTMAGIELARRHGLGVGCICTFTSVSAHRAQEVFDFFLGHELSFTVHAAVTPLVGREESWSLPPEQHGELVTGLLETYLANLSRIRISTLDSLCRSVSAGEGGICTFRDCLGDYLAVAPDGGIYPCQRFAGNPAFRIASVCDMPTSEQIEASPIWRMFREREQQVNQECGDCAHFAYCKGGCPYDALAAGDGSFGNLRDPYCTAYKRIFSHIRDQALDEVFSEENMAAVVEHRGGSLMRRGRLISLMGDGPHPYETAQQARRILGAVALAATGSAAEAARRLGEAGVVVSPERSEPALDALHKRLTAPVAGLNNLYLHVTHACNLRCAHCYAQSGPEHDESCAVTDIARACREGAELDFRHAVITGGEPLVHPERDRLLDALAEIRSGLKPLLTVLRTNLAMDIEPPLLKRIAGSTDEVVASVDGDRGTHDSRRGQGSYERTVANLRALVALGGDADVSIATVLPMRDANGDPGNSVRALARELGISRIRFRPVLPLGRASQLDFEIAPEALWGHIDPHDMIAYGFGPTSSCGMGQNLYVRPDGRAYPCYAWCGEGWYLGNVTDPTGLRGVIESEGFGDLGRHTVDTNTKCRECVLRYLCGGLCRAWRGGKVDDDLDTPPARCDHLQSRARMMISSALEHLGIPPVVWMAAGLPAAEGQGIRCAH